MRGQGPVLPPSCPYNNEEKEDFATASSRGGVGVLSDPRILLWTPLAMGLTLLTTAGICFSAS